MNEDKVAPAQVLDADGVVFLKRKCKFGSGLLFQVPCKICVVILAP